MRHVTVGTDCEAPEDVVARITKYLADKYPQCSPEEALASLPKDQRIAWLSGLSEQEQHILEYEWLFHARPKQRAPKGNWKVLIFLAGRGFGKTKSAAEVVRGWVESGEKKHIALLGATASDLRDTMVEATFKQGSGLLQICPPWNRPHYSPTKKTLVWTNPNFPSYGAVCSLYSAEEPNQLRSPSHDAAWIDEWCFVAGTKIETESGTVPIEHIHTGTRIWTRDGLRTAENAGCTGNEAAIYDVITSDGKCLSGTAEHPIYVSGRGFIPIRGLCLGDRLVTCKRQNRVLSGEADAGGSMAAIIRTGEDSYSIVQSTERRTVLFRKAWKFITRIATGLTTTFPISRCLLRKNIGDCMPVSGTVSLHGHSKHAVNPNANNGKEENHTLQYAASAISSTSRVPASRCTARQNVVRVHTGEVEKADMRYANTVMVDLPLATTDRSSVRCDAPTILESNHVDVPTRTTRLRRHVSSVLANLLPTITTIRRARESADMCCVVDVIKRKNPSKVFNLRVAGTPEYFANGILVHNCKMPYGDTAFHMLKFTMRLGKNPQIVISTTPKPVLFLIEMLQQAEESQRDGTRDIIVVKGNTYENRSNLSTSFLGDINQMYEGTTLGRQEIYADLILDAEGALWNLKMIDDFRLRMSQDGQIHFPSFYQTVIGVDPQTGYKDDSKFGGEISTKKTRIARSTLTGIVPVSMSMPVRGIPPHVYVRDDMSVNGKPEQWGKVVVEAYRKYQASLVIAESNQGGQMIKSVIQTVDPSVRVLLKTAVGKKHERAIPVVAKYQQGRVHHCGILSGLEQEMCIYEPGDEDKHLSPNRMDALVLAVRHLIVDGMRAGAGIAIGRRI